MEGLAPGQPRHTRERLTPVLAGLRRAVDGAPLPEGKSGGARPFVGWSLGRPWMLETAPHALLEASRPRG